MDADKRNHLLEETMEYYNTETSALHRKLQSKVEALKIMREQLETFRTERDQFKLMAETLQLRFSALKRNNTDYHKFDMDNKSSVLTLLNETREKNIKLSTEVESLKQKLSELQGDMQLLRNKNIESKQQTLKIPKTTLKSNLKLSNEELEWKNEKSNLIDHLEKLKKKNAQLAFDLKGILDEKEEAVTERDAYKCKAHRLNHELQIALKANDSDVRVVDIDGLVLENKYLQEKFINCESELKIARQCVTKYKNMLETKRKKGIIKLGTNNTSIMSHKQAKVLLEDNKELPSRAETIADLKSLCLALLDNLNDKNLALSHQKKTNKILAVRIAELEKRIQLMCGASTSSGTFSPSDILLNGYCSSAVDYECDHNKMKSSNITEDSGSDESNKLSQVMSENVVYHNDERNEGIVIKLRDDDGNEINISNDGGTPLKTCDGDDDDELNFSLSSESNRSIISSEYGLSSIDYKNITNIDDSNQDKNDKKNYIPDDNPLIRERLNDLKDLPTELAEMVAKALVELDLKEQKEKENQNINEI